MNSDPYAKRIPQLSGAQAVMARYQAEIDKADQKLKSLTEEYDVEVGKQKAALTALKKVDPLGTLTEQDNNVLFAVKADYTKETIETVMNYLDKKKTEATALRDSRLAEEGKAKLGLALNEQVLLEAQEA